MKKYLIPPFLKKLDEQLLFTAPNLWKSRLIYFIFYGVLIGFPLAYFAGSTYDPASKNSLNHTTLGFD
ncbi:MAG: hypothetical protein AAF696_38545, partial [Bacteroidota bacterium]